MRAFSLLAILLLSLAAPARAADDVAAAQRVIRSQIEAFSRDDAATAYSYAAPAIQEIFPQADIFMSMVRNSYAPVYRHKSFDFGEARVSDGTIAQRVHIVDADGVSWEALYTLEVQPDGSVKITGCVLLKPSGMTALRQRLPRRSLHGFGVIRRFVAGFGILPSRIVGSVRQPVPLAASSAPRFNISASLAASCL